MDHIKLEQLDADGAIRETAEAAGVDRADFLRKGLLGGAGFVAGGVLFNGLASPAAAAISTSRKSLANDIKIGNYALTLEYLEAEFYRRRSRTSAFSNDGLPLLRRDGHGDHEAAHVKALKGILGAQGRSRSRRSTSAPPSPIRRRSPRPRRCSRTRASRPTRARARTSRPGRSSRPRSRSTRSRRATRRGSASSTTAGQARRATAPRRRRVRPGRRREDARLAGRHRHRLHQG